MSDSAATIRRMKEFLLFAAQQEGSAVIFGVQFDSTEDRWLGAMELRSDRVLFPAGVGRAFVREMRELMGKSTKDLTAELKDSLGASVYEATFQQIEVCCKLAMERNAAKITPKFFGMDEMSPLGGLLD